MTERLFTFFVIDTRARWRAILLAWLAGSIAGSIMAATHASLGELATTCLSLSFIAFSGSVASYVFGARERLPHSQRRRAFVGLAYGGVAAALLVVVERLTKTPAAVHAATLVAAKDVQSNRPISEAQLASLVQRVSTVLSEGTHSTVNRKSLVSDYATAKAMHAAVVALKASNERFPPQEAQRTTIRFAPPAPTPGNSFVFGGKGLAFANLILETNSRDNSVVYCDNCGAVFIGVTIRGFSQKLDGITWINVHFENCSIEYDGGPVTLVNVSFVNCSVSFSSRVAEPIRLLLASKGPVTVSSDYPA